MFGSKSHFKFLSARFNHSPCCRNFFIFVFSNHKKREHSSNESDDEAEMNLPGYFKEELCRHLAEMVIGMVLPCSFIEKDEFISLLDFVAQK